MHICTRRSGPREPGLTGEGEIGEGTHLGRGGKPGGMPPEVSPRRIHPNGGGGRPYGWAGAPPPALPPETRSPFGRGPTGPEGTKAPPTTLSPSMLNC